MSGFDASWLDLREPADHRSRSEELAQLLTRHLGQPRPDLRRGHGLRHRLQPARHRTAARRRAALDAGRLRPAPARRGRRAAVRVGRPGRAHEQPARAEQGRQAHHGALAPRRPRPRPRARVRRRSADLVTASALFDLVSADFISEVAAEVVRCRAAFYTVLTYNGEQRWTPKHDADAAMASAFRAHQTRDKGFGEAAGPDGAGTAVGGLRRGRLHGERGRQRLAAGSRRRGPDRRRWCRASPAPCARPSWCPRRRSPTGSRSRAPAPSSATPTRWRCRARPRDRAQWRRPFPTAVPQARSGTQSPSLKLDAGADDVDLEVAADARYSMRADIVFVQYWPSRPTPYTNRTRLCGDGQARPVPVCFAEPVPLRIARSRAVP